MPDATYQRLSIVMPVYNEAATLRTALERLLAVEMPLPTEVRDRRRRLHRRVHRPHRRPGRRRAGAPGAPGPQPGQGRGAGRAASPRPGATCSPSSTPTWSTTRPTSRSLCQPVLDGEAKVVYGARSYGGHAAYSFWFVLGQQDAGPLGQHALRRLAHRRGDLPQAGPHRDLARGGPHAVRASASRPSSPASCWPGASASSRCRSRTGPGVARRARRSSGPTASRRCGSCSGCGSDDDGPPAAADPAQGLTPPPRGGRRWSRGPRSRAAGRAGWPPPGWAGW